jgi:DNA-binding transcriptional regulator YiaG
MAANHTQRWRKACDFTQSEAARVLGITLRNLQYYEAGTYEPPESVRRLMTAIYEVGEFEPSPGVIAKGRRK